MRIENNCNIRKIYQKNEVFSCVGVIFILLQRKRPRFYSLVRIHLKTYRVAGLRLFHQGH